MAGMTLLAAFLTTAAWAEVGGQDFQAGLTAFRGGDYLYALSRFQRARRAGMNEPKLHYNIGVCHYKLGDYPEAQDALRLALRSPALKALALYNLGLTALRMQDHQSAAQWFRQASASAQESRLKALAEHQLARLERPTRVDLKDWWVVSVGLNAGYDDHIIDPTEQQTQPPGDSLVDILAFASGPLMGTLRQGVRLDLSAYAVRYNRVTEYNMNLLRGGFALLQPLGNWQGEAAAHYETTTLDGIDYLDTTTATLAGSLNLAKGPRLRLRYRYSQITSLDSSSAPLEGWRQQFDAMSRWGGGSEHVAAEYRLELNQRDDLTSGTTFFSYSPTRHMITLRGEQGVGSLWVGRLEFAAQQSRYNDPHRLSDGSLVTREDLQYQARLRLRRPLGRGWEAALEYHHTHNESNLDTYDYTRNLYLIGLHALW